MSTRRPALAVAALVALSLVGGCGETREPGSDSTSTQSAPVSPSGESSTSAPPSRDPSPGATTSMPTALEPTPSADEMAMIRSFVAFALAPTADTAARVPFAEKVRLGLSRDLMATLDASTLTQRDAWTLEKPAFRGYVGPFNALDLIRQHAEETGSPAVRRTGGAFMVSSGDHPHCASPPVAPPFGLKSLRRVSVQPSVATTDGCLSWFTVDLFVDGQGWVAAVTLDLWEP